MDVKSGQQRDRHIMRGEMAPQPDVDPAERDGEQRVVGHPAGAFAEGRDPGSGGGFDHTAESRDPPPKPPANLLRGQSLRGPAQRVADGYAGEAAADAGSEAIRHGRTIL